MAYWSNEGTRINYVYTPQTVGEKYGTFEVQIWGTGSGLYQDDSYYIAQALRYLKKHYHAFSFGKATVKPERIKWFNEKYAHVTVYVHFTDENAITPQKF